jgi:hypothetical protein
VELHVLPRRHVTEATGRSLRDVGQAFELGRSQPPPRDPHANHLGVRLALAIHPVLQAEALEVIRRDAAGPEVSHELIERIDLSFIDP